MPSVDELIRSGRLVCPTTRSRLSPAPDGCSLVAEDGARRYRLIDGRVPMLLADEVLVDRYVADADRPRFGPGARPSTDPPNLDDRRSPASRAAFRSLFDDASDDAFILSVGGGPLRPDPRLVNLNIAPLPNVDVVADAHTLPCPDGAVDGVYCEAVLEHLVDPPQAVREMHRVLRPGRRAFLCTPFLQVFHGAPHHYQNFTVVGHRLLAESAGFTVLEAGTCVGPVFALVSLTGAFLRAYLPPRLAKRVASAWDLLGAILRPLDTPLHRHPNSHILASTTYVLAVKP